ncbi:hypothetical protein [Streptomyces sp. SID3343]|nr:hypothetical protein [Streptomyces sp. SID3343]
MTTSLSENAARITGAPLTGWVGAAIVVVVFLIWGLSRRRKR